MSSQGLVDKLKELQDSLTPPEKELRNRLKLLLQDAEKSDTKLWFDLTKILNDFFAVEAEVRKVDFNAFLDWFNKNLYPHIKENGGNYEFKGGTYYAPTKAGLKKILENDYTDLIKYTEKFVCVEFTVLLKARLAWVYHADGWGDFWTHPPDADYGHSFMFVWTCDNCPCGVEPQKPVAVWEYGVDAIEDKFYKLENTQNFRY